MGRCAEHVCERRSLDATENREFVLRFGLRRRWWWRERDDVPWALDDVQFDLAQGYHETRRWLIFPDGHIEQRFFLDFCI
jgi:hypothetical protein